MARYKGRRPVRSGGSIFGFFIAFIIIANILDGFLFVAPLIPIVFVIFIIYMISKSKNSTNEVRYTRSDFKNMRTREPKVNVDTAAIDEKLKEYFKDNYRLPVYDDIYLVTKSGDYEKLTDLTIYKGEEYIMTLKEFKDRYQSTYDEIVKLLDTFAKTVKEEVKTETKKETRKLSKAQSYISEINSLNVDIQKEEIKSGLYQTCALLKQIDLSADQNDDDKIHKLYDYYLPILLKILKNYRTLLEVSKGSDDFKECESQLIKTIVLINEALKTINESLHEDDYMDLSADITTLQSLLKKDGLVRSGTIYEGSGEDGKQG